MLDFMWQNIAEKLRQGTWACLWEKSHPEYQCTKNDIAIACAVLLQIDHIKYTQEWLFPTWITDLTIQYII